MEIVDSNIEQLSHAMVSLVTIAAFKQFKSVHTHATVPQDHVNAYLEMTKQSGETKQLRTIFIENFAFLKKKKYGSYCEFQNDLWHVAKILRSVFCFFFVKNAINILIQKCQTTQIEGNMYMV